MAMQHARYRVVLQAEWSDTRGTPAVLHVANDFALQPDGVGHRREQHKECDHSLDQRDRDETFNTQQCRSSSKAC